MAVTKYVLKHPVTAILALVCLVVFAWKSVTGAKMEMMPEMNVPTLMVMTMYTGASPEDINELITKPLEDSMSELKGLKQLSSQSTQEMSTIILQYEYGTNMETAYDNLKKKVDTVAADFPKVVTKPFIIEMTDDVEEDIYMVADNPSETNIYDYVKKNVVPELKKLPAVAKVTVSGGAERYVRVQLSEEKIRQYGVTMQSIADDIAGADFSVPAGKTKVGSQGYSVTTRQKYNTPEQLNQIPLTTSSGQVLYLEDVAKVSMAAYPDESIARYNGNPTVSIQITKQQSSTAMELSKQVKNLSEDLMEQRKNLRLEIINDNADIMKASLKEVANTLILAVVISMIVIWLFFGDMKASLIVGSSIPISIFTSLIAMKLMNLSLNVITLSALTLGVGMMVDNSIVVLESCFRITEKKQSGFWEYMSDALEGASVVGSSVAASTVTTCVVFLPLAFLKGMTGQMFRPLGFTIVFCMIASLISAITIVPLFYMMYHPKEKEAAPLSRPLILLQDQYREILSILLPKKKLVMGTSVLLLIAALLLGTTLKTELMDADDQGIVTVTVNTRPGMRVEKIDGILKNVEGILAEYEDVRAYMTEVLDGNNNINVFLKKKRSMKTEELIKRWRKQMAEIPDCTIKVENAASMSMMSKEGEKYELILKGGNYTTLKEVSKKITDILEKRPELLRVTSDSGSSAPLVEILVDGIKAKKKGLDPSEIGSTVYSMISGTEARTLNLDGQNVSVIVKYPEDKYEKLDQIKDIVLRNSEGAYVALEEVAKIGYKDNPASVNREGKQYIIKISALYTDQATDKTEEMINTEVVSPNLGKDVTIGINATDRSMNEEFSALKDALLTAVFLIFVVMAAQFESPKFSVMVMVTIPFSLIGSFGLLWLANGKISMTSLLGFLVLIGTVVNSGILYVDTVNQYRLTMEQKEALIEAGATRLRPILMTTMTTILSMIPMAIAIGSTGSTTRDLALVNIGGLTASTILSLLMLPVFYSIMNRREKQQKEVLP